MEGRFARAAKGMNIRPILITEHFYITTNKDAENFKVVRAPLSDPSEKNWTDIIPYNPEIKIEA